MCLRLTGHNSFNVSTEYAYTTARDTVVSSQQSVSDLYLELRVVVVSNVKCLL